MGAVDPSAYKDVLRVREAWRFDIGGLLMRMFSAMTVLAVITTLTLCGWEFVRAGSVSTVLALALFIVGPKVSKAIDERGQSKIIPYAVTVALAGCAFLVAIIEYSLPWWLSYVAAVLMGFAPNVPSIARTRWSYLIESGCLLRGPRAYERMPQIKVAFALEGVLDDASYMLGPSVAIALSAALFPTAGLLFAIVVLIVGTALLLSSRETEPEPGWKPAEEHAGEVPGDAAASGEATSPGDAAASGDASTLAAANKPAVKQRNMFFSSSVVRAFFCVLFMVGVFYGAHDTTVIAVGELIGNPGLASIILLLGSAFSIVGSIVFGMLKLSVGLDKQMLVLSFLFSVSYGLMLFSNDIVMLLVVCSLSALFFGPTLVIVNTLCEHCVPSARLTESLTWVNAGFSLGTALIPTLCGVVIDAFGAWQGVHFAGILAWTVFAVAFVIRPIVRKSQN